jgi:hypothetical protein
MKKIVIIFSSSFSQFVHFKGKLSFENNFPFDPDTLIYFWESKDSPGIWEVKQPDGIFFDESRQNNWHQTQTFGGTYALVTNKNLMHEPIDTSVLYIKFKDDSYLHNDSFIDVGAVFSFFYKIDADTSESLSMKMSIDKGKTWKTVFDYADYRNCSVWGAWGVKDSSAPLTGEKIGWVWIRINIFEYLGSLFNQNVNLTNVVLKFEFIANKNSQTEGMMLDEFRLSYQAFSSLAEENDENLVKLQFNQQLHKIVLSKSPRHYFLVIYNTHGQILERRDNLNSEVINMSSLNKYNGLFILSFTDKKTGNTIHKKVIK